MIVLIFQVHSKRKPQKLHGFSDHSERENEGPIQTNNTIGPEKDLQLFERYAFIDDDDKKDVNSKGKEHIENFKVVRILNKENKKSNRTQMNIKSNLLVS